MQKTLILISLFITFQTFSQSKEKFKPGVKVITLEKVEGYQKPASILFVFEGHTHLVSFFLDLESHLKKRFKKEIKKGLKLDFKYELYAKEAFESDLALIPKRNFSKNQYEVISYISISDFKGWDDHLFKKRKQNYNLNVILKDSDTNQLLKLILNASNYFTISRSNKKSSKLIYKHLIEQ